MKNKRGQIGMEYLILMGFILLTLTGLFVLGFAYAENIKDEIIMSQISGFSEKIIISAEKVFYQGAPSKTTVVVYIPNEIKNFEIIEDSLFIDFETSKGSSRRAYYSNVPIEGFIDPVSGSRKIQIIAQENIVNITQV